MSNNIININQNIELENKLKRDAIKLDDEISPQLREQLFCQLSNQTIKNKPINHSTNAFSKNKMAIAASFIFAVFIIQLFVADPTIKEPTVASINSVNHIDESLFRFSSEFKRQDLLASQDLNNEYNAILADIEKIKRKIVTL